MKTLTSCAFVAVLAAATPAIGGAQAADQHDRKFFKSVEGTWTGPGEIVAGKYKGTRFNCTFAGKAPLTSTGMTLDGGCRVGVFTQKMTATIQKNGKGYSGTFQDGAAGKGLDVVSGNVVSDRKVVFGLNRKQLKGAMQARLPDDNSMVVTVSVRVEQEMVPVIGVNLKRVDGVAVGTVAQE